MPVDAQVGDRPGHGVDDQQAGRAHGALLAAGGEAGHERADEAVAEILALGVLEGVDHRLGHALVGQQVAGRDAAGALGGRRGGRACGRPSTTATRPAASTHVSWRNSAWAAAAISCVSASGAERPLASRSSSRRPSDGSVMFWDAAAPTPARAWAQRAATAGLDDVTTMPKRPLSRTARGERERHDCTAMTSISTTHSGRASATTTSPVKAGKTPRRRSPSTR